MKQEFYDLAKKIAVWHAVTFKDADKTGQLLKLDEEFDEWLAVFFCLKNICFLL